MATLRKPIDDMSKNELKDLVKELLEERVEFFEEDFEVEFDSDDEPDSRSPEEILRSMTEHRWTPPPGSPSPAEMIREDRDR